jgi:hypothetical protein
MKKLLGILALLILFAWPTLAQDTPVFEVGAGYQYRSFNFPAEPRLNMNGWQISADANINHWIGLTADFDGTYKNFRGGDNAVYSYMFGPQIYPLGHHVITPYVNALFGASHYRFYNCGGSGCGGGQTEFAWGAGGGVDLKISRHFAIRMAQVEYERTGFFNAGSASSPYQNNFKVGAGLLIRFGER